MIALIGLIIGIAVGVFWDISIPPSLSPYLSVAIFACLDSVFGAFRGTLEKTFRTDIFISGFFGNAILAVALVFLGDKLGIPVYLAAVIVFGGRIFNNFAIIRRLLKKQPPFQADKEHLHHQLLGMNFSPRTTVLIIYAINILFAMASIFYTLKDQMMGIALYVIIFILVIWFVFHTSIISDKNPKLMKKVEEKLKINIKKNTK